jgi:hypothetical protein
MNNSQLNELEVSVGDGTHNSLFFNHLFLENAVNLTSYSFEGKAASEARLKPLLTFIATHKSLSYLSLNFLDWEDDSFESTVSFYEKLVSAIHANSSIMRVRLVFDVWVLNLGTSALLFSEKLRPLIGRDLILNTILVDDIISDLDSGLTDGLLWDSIADQDYQSLSFE